MSGYCSNHGPYDGIACPYPPPHGEGKDRNKNSPDQVKRDFSSDESSLLAGRYVLKRLVSQGRMGQLYQAWDQYRSTDMAVKIIHDSSLFEYVVREVSALEHLTHPNIVRFYDVGFNKEKLVAFIVMDWVDGVDLQKIIEKRNSLSVDEVSFILSDLQGALSYAHKMRICHCDIKPGNILIKRTDNRAILSNFGLAHVSNPHSAP